MRAAVIAGLLLLALACRDADDRGSSSGPNAPVEGASTPERPASSPTGILALGSSSLGNDPDDATLKHRVEGISTALSPTVSSTVIAELTSTPTPIPSPTDVTIEADRDSKWEDSDAKAALRDYLISITGSEDRNQSMLFTVLTSMSKWAIAYLDDGWWELKADELGHLDRISQYYSDIGVNLMYMREGACNIWNIDWTDVAVIANPSDYPKECVKWFGTGEYVGVQVPNPEGVWRVSERRGTVLAESIAAENLLACLVITRVDICG